MDIGKVDEPLILVTTISLAVEADALKPVSILSAINCLASDDEPLNVATDELIAWSVVVSEALIFVIAKVDDPLILVTNTSLAVDAELLNADIGAVDEPLILVTNTSLAVDADPLSVDIGEVDEPLT